MSGPRVLRRWMHGLRNCAPILLLGVFPAAIILVLPALTPWLGGGQTWVLSTQSHGVQISFRGQNNVWPLTDATLCVPRAQPLRQAPNEDRTSPCDGRRFEVTRPEQVMAAWSDGTVVDLRKTGDQTEILVRQGTQLFPDGTLILLPDSEIHRLGTLGFTGTAEIGTLMSTGARSFLVEGHFEVREIGLLSRIFGRQTDVVKKGELTRGDVVAVVSAAETGELVNGFGHITLSETQPDALNIVFLSADHAAALRINALGQEHPAVLQPDWLERALANPFLVVAALFASLAGSFMQLYEGVRSQLRRAGKPPEG